MALWNKTEIRTDWKSGPITPQDVLYEFDGPSIFISQIGLTPFLFLKQDEEDGKELFLATSVSENEISNLKSGRVSIRGMVNHKDGWLIESGWDYHVKRYQKQNYSEFEKYLPQSGIGISSRFGRLPDSVEQAQSFLSFKYESPEMSDNSIPLSVLKDLIDKTSNIIRQSLLPRGLQHGKKRKLLDFSVAPIEFASLLIAVKEPRFDTVTLKRRKGISQINLDSLASDAIERGGLFLDDLINAASIAENNSMSKTEAEDNFEIIDRIADVVPSKHNELTTLQITVNTINTAKTIIINREVGDRISDARRSVSSLEKTIIGTITEINGTAKTFIVREDKGPEVTVSPIFEVYKLMDEERLVAMGTRLSLTGRYWERIRRDYMSLTSYRVLNET